MLAVMKQSLYNLSEFYPDDDHRRFTDAEKDWRHRSLVIFLRRNGA